MGFIDWIKGVGNSIWNGIKHAGSWAKGVAKGALGLPNDDTNPDVQAGVHTGAGLKEFIPGALHAIETRNPADLIDPTIKAFKQL